MRKLKLVECKIMILNYSDEIIERTSIPEQRDPETRGEGHKHPDPLQNQSAARI